jgi:hypothetical protein
MQLIANHFCNVTNLIVIEPLATNITQQGTLKCPVPPPLAIAPAVLVSWLAETNLWTAESAPSVNAPRMPSDATPFTQHDTSPCRPTARVGSSACVNQNNKRGAAFLHSPLPLLQDPSANRSGLSQLLRRDPTQIFHSPSH